MTPMRCTRAVTSVIRRSADTRALSARRGYIPCTPRFLWITVYEALIKIYNSYWILTALTVFCKPHRTT